MASGPARRGPATARSRGRALLFRLAETHRAFGRGRLPGALAWWLVRREYLVTARDVRGPWPASPPVVGVRWRPLAARAIPRLVETHDGLTEPEIRRRLDEGQECWVGWLAEAVVHWRWETTREVFLPYLGRTLRPLVEDLAVVDVYTVPALRGQGLYAASTGLAVERARERGLRRLIGLVAPWNRPARRAMDRMGRAPVGAVGYWRAGPWRRYYANGAVRFDERGALVVGREAVPPAGRAAGPGAPGS